MGKTYRKERTKPKENTKKPIKRCKKVTDFEEPDILQADCK